MCTVCMADRYGDVCACAVSFFVDGLCNLFRVMFRVDVVCKSVCVSCFVWMVYVNSCLFCCMCMYGLCRFVSFLFLVDVVCKFVRVVFCMNGLCNFAPFVCYKYVWAL